MLLARTVALGQPQVSGRPGDEDRLLNRFGVTGLISLPSAYVQRGGQLSVYGAGDRDLLTVGAAVGIANRLEVGAGYFHSRAAITTSRDGLVVDGKWNLVPEQLLRPALSVGVADAASRLQRGAGWYVVASKDLIRYFGEALAGWPVALKVHAGFGGGVFGNRAFAGGELFITPAVSAMAENVDGHWNLGARLHGGHLYASAGLLDFRRASGEIGYSTAMR